ncbi:hypothetical protein DL93DRAFT_2161662 [Clavulina sp. PMI_390]|nr:hypothetical protein DL93DRAFT_2161662 [Clavulina sp. PMI_390]
MSQDCVIAANPDAAGVGVRISIYIQAFLPIVSCSIELIRRRPIVKNPQLERNLTHTAVASLLTGAALLISAIIQHQCYYLGTFHAVIVLNLCWITVLGSVAASDMVVQRMETYPTIMLRKSMKPFVAVSSIKMCLMGAFGIWMLQSPAKFDNASPGCTSQTVFVFFGHLFSVTSPSFRYPLLLLNSTAFIPILNITMINWLCMLIDGMIAMPFLAIWAIYRPQSMRRWVSDERLSILVSWTVALMNVMLTVTTEMNIRANNVGPDENQWGLGQTFAVLVSLLPAGNIVHQLYDLFCEVQGKREGAISPLLSSPKRESSAQTQSAIESEKIFPLETSPSATKVMQQACPTLLPLTNSGDRTIRRRNTS